MTLDWRSRGNCVRVDPDVMFPTSNAEEVTRAQSVCAGCPVADECLRDGERMGEFDSVRAGLEGPARRRLAREGDARVPCARCRRPFVPAQANQRRCKQCTHVSYRESKGLMRQYECPTCERSVGLWHGGLRPHKWHGPQGWGQCPGTGAEVGTPQPA